MSQPLANLSLTPTGTPAAAAPPTSPEALENAAREFEGIFLAQFLDSLSAGLSAEGGGESDVYRDMLNDEMAQLISRTGGIGVADAVLREMLKMQEVA
jgi:flagellar protein FlgJ